MLKRQELTDPTSCMSKAKDDEMTFVLLARDASAPGAIREWCRDRVYTGKNKWDDAQIAEAMACADAMEKQRASGALTTAPKPA